MKPRGDASSVILQNRGGMAPRLLGCHSALAELIDRDGGPEIFFKFCRQLDELKESAKADGVEGAEDPQTAQAGTGDNSKSLLVASA